MVGAFAWLPRLATSAVSAQQPLLPFDGPAAFSPRVPTLLPANPAGPDNRPSPALAGIQLQGEWILFWLVYYTTLSVGIILAYFIASISPNLDVANAVSSWREGQGAENQWKLEADLPLGLSRGLREV